MGNVSRTTKYLLLIVVGILVPPIGVVILAYIVLKRFFGAKGGGEVEARVRTFVGTYFPGGSGGQALPRTVLIPPEDVEAFHALLKKGGLSVDISKLNRMINETSLVELERRLVEFLRRMCPDLPARPSISRWVTAYVRTLGEDVTYAPILARVARTGAAELTEAIRSEAAEFTRSDRMARIAAAMKTGGGAQAPRYSLNAINRMDGTQFEKFLGELFARMGYSVQVTGRAGDQGCDVLIERAGEKTVVQAKCYSHPVTNDAVQEAVAAKALYGAAKAMVATNSVFTESAKELARVNGVQLWDREKLSGLLSQFF